jgi:truncated hemoglobin YjbI
MQKTVFPAKPFTVETLKNYKGDNKALSFYTSNARTAFFMLQAIARLNSKAFNDRVAEMHLKRFKKLEDLLGAVDHYDALHKHLGAIRTAQPAVLAYFEKKRDKALNKLNKAISKSDLQKELKQAAVDLSVPHDAVSVQQLKRAYQEEVDDVLAFFEENKDGFHAMEEHVHELRRKLRWLSIYAQAYGGLFELKSATKKPAWEKTYLTPEVIKSPFNKLPVSKAYFKKVQINKTRFYALSYMIQQLGIIKDEGLTQEALTKALRKTEDMDKKTAATAATAILKQKHTHDSLLKKAFALTQKALEKDKILDKFILE